MDAAEAKRILRGREKHPTLYMPLDLTEFADWRVSQPCTERARMIEGFIGEFFHGVPASEGDFAMLDVGCHTGWFVRHFRRTGWTVRGLEPNAQWREVAVWAHEQHFPEDRAPGDPLGIERCYYLGDALGIPTMLGGVAVKRVFEVVLALSMLMYPFRQGHSTGLATVRRLRELGDVVVIDFGGQYAGYLPFDESNCVGWMLDHGGFDHGKLLGHSDFEHRPLFAFW